MQLLQGQALELVWHLQDSSRQKDTVWYWLRDGKTCLLYTSKQAGIAYATEQIIDLIANGVNHIHIYSMNKPDVAAAIMNNLSQIYVREQA